MGKENLSWGSLEHQVNVTSPDTKGGAVGPLEGLLCAWPASSPWVLPHCPEYVSWKPQTWRLQARAAPFPQRAVFLYTLHGKQK